MSVASSQKNAGWRPEDDEREEKYRNIIDSFEEKKRKMNEMIRNQMKSLNFDVYSEQEENNLPSEETPKSDV